MAAVAGRRGRGDLPRTPAGRLEVRVTRLPQEEGDAVSDSGLRNTSLALLKGRGDAVVGTRCHGWRSAVPEKRTFGAEQLVTLAYPSPASGPVASKAGPSRASSVARPQPLKGEGFVAEADAMLPAAGHGTDPSPSPRPHGAGRHQTLPFCKKCDLAVGAGILFQHENDAASIRDANFPTDFSRPPALLYL